MSKITVKPTNLVIGTAQGIVGIGIIVKGMPEHISSKYKELYCLKAPDGFYNTDHNGKKMLSVFTSLQDAMELAAHEIHPQTLVLYDIDKDEWIEVRKQEPEEQELNQELFIPTEEWLAPFSVN